MITPEEIRELYDKEVTSTIKYNHYSTEKVFPAFESTATLINDNKYDPEIFIKAMFDYSWYKHTERGFRKLEYPFPRMLYSKKADWIYNRYLSKFGSKPIIDSIEEEVIRSSIIVKKLDIDEIQLFDLYDEGRISIYYLVLNSKFNKIYNSYLSSGTILDDFKRDYDNARKFIFNLPTERFYNLSSIVRGGNGK
jgi:hypothetical protein